jgi:hypothetical protein
MAQEAQLRQNAEYATASRTEVYSIDSTGAHLEHPATVIPGAGRLPAVGMSPLEPAKPLSPTPSNPSL